MSPLSETMREHLGVHEGGKLSGMMWTFHEAARSRLAWSRDSRAARRSASATGVRFCTHTARCVRQANAVSCFCSINFMDSEHGENRYFLSKFGHNKKYFHALPTSPDVDFQLYIRPYIFVACSSPISLSFSKSGVMSSGMIDTWGVRTRTVSLKQIWAFPAVSAATVWRNGN